MLSVWHAVLRSWSIPLPATFALAITTALYLRGWWLLRRAGVPFLPMWRAGSFALGVLTLWVALASPLDTFSPFVLTAHMLQHMLLMMVAPPLILLGAPLIPIVRGMPIFAAREFAGPFLNWPAAQKIGYALTQPVVALLLMGTFMLGWHVPRLYELALTSSSWHDFEHACFFLTSLIFWWPVVQPWPSLAQWPRWSMVPYLVVADLLNTVLSAILVFSDHVLYPSYASGPQLFGFPPLEDQAASGAIMWVIGSLAFVVPAALIAVQCLSRQQPKHAVQHAGARQERYSGDRVGSIADPCRANHLTLGMTRRTVEVVSFLICFGLASLCFMWLLSQPGDDDDQSLRFSQQSGEFVVSVFGPRGELHPGPTGLAILVQSAQGHAVLLDGTVTLTAKPQTSGRRRRDDHPRQL